MACFYFNEVEDAWSKEDVSVVFEDDKLICKTSHLTMFAGLDDLDPTIGTVSKDDDEDKLAEKGWFWLIIVVLIILFFGSGCAFYIYCKKKK